jgi:recombination protein U
VIDNQRAALRYQNKVNNAQGHFFESAIKAACALYSDRERADVDKTPEPFRVLEKSRDGKFKGRFTARAQPDFQGTLDGGRSIVFEAKYTTTDRLKWDVLTQEQRDTLERHARRGALAAVCGGSASMGRCYSSITSTTKGAGHHEKTAHTENDGPRHGTDGLQPRTPYAYERAENAGPRRR